jgi:thiamine-phosphate pyrophosphorylase
VPFIVNDHIDLCLKLDADGIHVGGTDASVAVVRTLIGKDKILGASCYGDFALAEQAQIAGASYVAFGGFYPSRVKKYEVSTPASIVSKAKSELTVPVCVIGGMTPENAKPLVREGADMVAAISSVYSAADIATAVREFVAIF